MALWMLAVLQSKGELYQNDAAFEIERRFGAAFLYDNDMGNTAIHRTVLAEFRKLTGDSVVWERGEKRWRNRERTDDAGRLQQD